MGTPCTKCITMPVCRQNIKSIEPNIEFERTTTPAAVANVLMEVALFKKCVYLSRYLFDDDYRADYPKTQLVMKAMNIS